MQLGFSSAITNTFTGYSHVNTFADLPPAGGNTNEYWIVDNTTGIILINQKKAGFYKSDGTNWNYIGAAVDVTSLSDGVTSVTGTPVKLVGSNGVTVNSDVDNTALNIVGNSNTKANLAGGNTFTGNQTFDTDTLFVDSVNDSVGIGTASPTNPLTQKSTTALESAPLGAELLTSSNWTSTGWTGDFDTGFTHTTGNVTALSNTLAAVINNLYQITFTVTNRTAGSFTITYGGVTNGSYTSSNACGPKAVSTGAFSIVPTSDFNGTIIISLKRITGTYNATYAIQDNLGVNTIEIRSSLNTLNNTFIGKSAGRYNTTGSSNSAQGVYALQNNTTGSNNSAQGYGALQNNTTGSNNSAQGVYALQNNTTGSNNLAQGYGALQNNTTGNSNSAQGYGALQNNTTGSNNLAQGVCALQNNTTGSNNLAQGVYALQNNTTGSNNSAQGVNAGRYLANGSTGRTTGNNGIYLGYNSKASANGTDNEIVIGNNAIGKGSNTVVLGNTSTTATYLAGKLNIGTVSEYADNTTALAGGLGVGDVYRTDDLLKVVH